MTTRQRAAVLVGQARGAELGDGRARKAAAPSRGNRLAWPPAWPSRSARKPASGGKSSALPMSPGVVIDRRRRTVATAPRRNSCPRNGPSFRQAFPASIVAELRAREADDAGVLRQPLLAVQFVQRRNQLAAGQVARARRRSRSCGPYTSLWGMAGISPHNYTTLSRAEFIRLRTER